MLLTIYRCLFVNQIPRIGPQHQAGSDSLLTALAFFKMKQVFFDGVIDDDLYMGCLFGLSNA
jgi:CCR4-NOT transcription complex subunit 7/8